MMVEAVISHKRKPARGDGTLRVLPRASDQAGVVGGEGGEDHRGSDPGPLDDVEHEAETLWRRAASMRWVSRRIFLNFRYSICLSVDPDVYWYW